MADYRQDGRSRCSRCGQATPAEDLFMTVAAETLCASCRLAWAEEERKDALLGGAERSRYVPGFRLMCPHCNAATMHVRQGDFSLVAVCSQCKRSSRRHRGGSFLAFALGFMMTPFADAAIGWPVLSCLLAAWMFYSIGKDLVGRRRHRIATVEEVEAAERLEQEAERTRVRVAVQAQLAEPGTEAHAIDDQAELEAATDAPAPREHTSR